MRRIAIVGTERRSELGDDFQITACCWNRLGRLKNVRDYDVVILCLSEVDPDTMIDWKTFWKLFTPESFIGVVGHGGQVIILGDPRIKSPIGRLSPTGSPAATPFLAWTSMNFRWDSGAATTTTAEYLAGFSGLQPYFERLHHAQYSLSAVEYEHSAPEGYVHRIGEQWRGFDVVADVSLVPRVFALSAPRYESPTAFAITLQAVALDSRKVVLYEFELGPLVLLPSIPVSAENQIDLILGDYLGFGTVDREPTWVADIEVPGQFQVDDAIEQIDEQVAALLRQKDDLLQERAELRSILRLLYDRDYGLEDIVRVALSLLGAEIEDPTDPKKEDGWLYVEYDGIRHIGVLEVKSTKGETFGEGGLRQLLDWKMRGVQHKGLAIDEIKGIFVGNSAYDQNWVDRPDPFPANWVKTAQLSGACGVTSSALFVALKLVAAGRLAQDNFWRLIFETDGIVEESAIANQAPPDRLD